MNFLDRMLSLPRSQKRLICAFVDVVFIFTAFFGAYFVRWGHLNFLNVERNWFALVCTLVITLAVFIQLGLYKAVLRYLSFHALFIISLGAVISAMISAVSAFYFHAPMPRTVPIIYGSFLGILCIGARLLVRYLATSSLLKSQIPVAIYGAGSAGRQLAISLRQSESYSVKAFIDEDVALKGVVIQGLTVCSPDALLTLLKSKQIEKVFLALPRASRAQRKRIIDSLVDFSIEVLTVPSLADILSGRAKIDELKNVPIEDLLGRDQVTPHTELMQANIKDRVVMVTGAGGSIGSELCRQIIHQQPKTLILFEVYEYGLYAIERELVKLAEKSGVKIKVLPLLGSVQRKNRLVGIMKAFNVDTVYHAAAYKHVPLVEYNVVEGVRNNIFGTLACAEAAIKAGVSTFVLISTDKAVRPTNVMGASKRMAELVLQALSEKQSITRFCMVRFGNVLGSSGSVVPLFKRQIQLGGPVTVTHPEITRYFMTIPEAAQLVIQAGAMGTGGDVFVLDMGESVKIVDLARKLIHLSGLELKNGENENGDIEIKYTGLRPGEKLYEELLIGDNVSITAHERIMKADEQFLKWNNLEFLLKRLGAACHAFEYDLIRDILLEAPVNFNPTNDICDLVWQAKSESIDTIEEG